MAPSTVTEFGCSLKPFHPPQWHVNQAHSGGRALHQPSLRPRSRCVRWVRLTSCQTVFRLVAMVLPCSHRPPTIPVLLTNLLAFFSDSEASICQQSSAFQTLGRVIVHQLAPHDSNLPHAAAALVPNRVRFFVSPPMLITWLLWKSQFLSTLHVGRQCTAGFWGWDQTA